MEPSKTAEIVAAHRTDVGQKRSSNQDAVGEYQRADGHRLFVVADGMGGHRGGETASALAVQRIGEIFESSDAPPNELLPVAFQMANTEIRSRAAADASLAGMGTTGVAIHITPEREAWIAHVGDSRAYLLRGGQLELLTADHSVVGEMCRRGLISAEEAAVHPRRNELLRSIGSAEEVDVDVAMLRLLPGDHLLLCSDGLHGVVDEIEIVDAMEGETPRSAAERLIGLANAAGGPDNITALAIRVPGAFPEELEGRRGLSLVALALLSATALLVAYLTL